MEVRLRLTRVRVAVLAVIVAAVAASVAWAASPGDGGVIQGCYDSGGNVKVVAALPCPKGYTALQWNVQGVKGDQGIQGIQGEKGDKGDKGDQGIQGMQGIKGDKGDKGDQGIQGIQGTQGPQGPGGVTTYQIAFNSTRVGIFSTNDVSVDCPPGTKVVGGGVRTGGEYIDSGNGRPGYAQGNTDMNVQDSFPVDDNTWFVRAYYGGPFTDSDLGVYAMCVSTA